MVTEKNTLFLQSSLLDIPVKIAFVVMSVKQTFLCEGAYSSYLRSGKEILVVLWRNETSWLASRN